MRRRVTVVIGLVLAVVTCASLAQWAPAKKQDLPGMTTSRVMPPDVQAEHEKRGAKANSYMESGYTALAAGNTREAESQFLNAYHLMPYDGVTMLALAHLYQKEGKKKDAAHFWHELIYPQHWGSSVSSDPRVRSEYILLLLEHPDAGGAAWRESVALFNQSLQETGDPVDPSLYFDPKVPSYARMRGRAHFVLGSGDYTHGPVPSEEKLAHLEVAARALPDMPGVQLQLGMALEKAGRIEEAATAFHMAQELHPTDKRTVSLLRIHVRSSTYYLQVKQKEAAALRKSASH